MAVPTNQDIRDLTKITVEEFSDETIDALIATADLIVSNAGLGLNQDTIDEIHKYVTAHLTTDLYPHASQIKTGDSQETFEGSPTGINLKSSRYGRTACLLDTTGKLSQLGGVKPLFRAIGRTARTPGRYK